MPSLRFDAFIFDMNGTLIDDMPYHNETWVELLADLGVSISAEEFFRQTAGMTNTEIFRLIVKPDLTPDEIHAHATTKEARYREIYRPHLAPLGGLLDFLDAADSAGIRMAVATSAPAENIDFVLDGLDLRRRFDAVVGAADITRGKPDPEIFLACADRLGAAPDRCLVFEDAPSGIEAARRAGMQCVVLTTILTPDEVAGQPHVIAALPDFTALSTYDILSTST